MIPSYTVENTHRVYDELLIRDDLCHLDIYPSSSVYSSNASNERNSTETINSSKPLSAWVQTCPTCQTASFPPQPTPYPSSLCYNASSLNSEKSNITRNATNTSQAVRPLDLEYVQTDPIIFQPPFFLPVSPFTDPPTPASSAEVPFEGVLSRDDVHHVRFRSNQARTETSYEPWTVHKDLWDEIDSVLELLDSSWSGNPTEPQIEQPKLAPDVLEIPSSGGSQHSNDPLMPLEVLQEEYMDSIKAEEAFIDALPQESINKQQTPIARTHIHPFSDDSPLETIYCTSRITDVSNQMPTSEDYHTVLIRQYKASKREQTQPWPLRDFQPTNSPSSQDQRPKSEPRSTLASLAHLSKPLHRRNLSDTKPLLAERKLRKHSKFSLCNLRTFSRHANQSSKKDEHRSADVKPAASLHEQLRSGASTVCLQCQNFCSVVHSNQPPRTPQLFAHELPSKSNPVLATHPAYRSQHQYPTVLKPTTYPAEKTLRDVQSHSRQGTKQTPQHNESHPPHHQNKSYLPPVSPPVPLKSPDRTHPQASYPTARYADSSLTGNPTPPAQSTAPRRPGTPFVSLRHQRPDTHDMTHARSLRSATALLHRPLPALPHPLYGHGRQAADRTVTNDGMRLQGSGSTRNVGQHGEREGRVNVVNWI